MICFPMLVADGDENKIVIEYGIGASDIMFGKNIRAKRKILFTITSHR